MKSEKSDSEQEPQYPWRFGFQGPRWFAEPIPVEIPAAVKVYSFFEEAGVRITAKGLDKSILVPSYAVDEDRQVVKGTLMAETGDGSSILVYFPPTCLGSARIAVDHNLAAEWANKGARNHGAV